MYVFMVNECAIKWRATLQTTNEFVSTKSEYMTIVVALKGVIWLKGLFGELNEDLQIIIILAMFSSPKIFMRGKSTLMFI